MSRFSTVIMVPGNLTGDDVYDAAMKLLRPYQDGPYCKEHEELCYCVREFKCTAHTEAEKATLEFARNTFSNWHDIQEQGEPNFSEFYAQELSKLEKPTDILDLSAVACPECELCDGTGMIVTEFNPSPYWDSFKYECHVLYWRGYSEDLEGAKWVGNHHSSVLRVSEIPETYVPEVVVTPEGEWMESNSPVRCIFNGNKYAQEWVSKFKALKETYSDHLAVLTVMEF